MTGSALLQEVEGMAGRIDVIAAGCGRTSLGAVACKIARGADARKARRESEADAPSPPTSGAGSYG